MICTVGDVCAHDLLICQHCWCFFCHVLSYYLIFLLLFQFYQLLTVFYWSDLQTTRRERKPFCHPLVHVAVSERVGLLWLLCFDETCTSKWFLKVLVTALCSFASWCIMLVVLETLCCWIHWKLSRVRHGASRGTSCVAVFRCRRRSSKISVVLWLGWISTQNRSGQSIVHLSFANVAWRRSFCVVAKYDWAHSNQFESRNQVVLWNTYVHSCEEYKDFCDRTSSVLKHAKHALFSSQLQDASDAMFEAFSMTEERLQAVSLACDDDGHDAPQPNKSVKLHPWYCDIRPIQSLDMKSSLACLVRICCKKHWEFVGNRPQVLCPQWLHPMPQLNEAENIVGHPVGHLLDIWTATESQAARAELRIAAHSCGPPGTYWFPWIGCAEPSLETTWDDLRICWGQALGTAVAEDVPGHCYVAAGFVDLARFNERPRSGHFAVLGTKRTIPYITFKLHLYYI